MGQDDLKTGVAIELSVGGLLKKVITESNERMSNHTVGLHPRKLIYCAIILKRQVTWTPLNAYHKISRFIER